MYYYFLGNISSFCIPMKKSDIHLRLVVYDNNKININFHFKGKNRKYIFKALFGREFYTVNKIFYLRNWKNRICLNRKNKMLREIEEMLGETKLLQEVSNNGKTLKKNILQNTVFFPFIFI